MLTRRAFLNTMGLMGSSFLLGSTGCTKISAALTKTKHPKQLPNIIFILADDMGYGDLACQNPESKIPTPNLDKLAQQGTRFTNSHSPSAVCSPTRYAILTGRYCWRTRLKRWVLWPWEKPLIDKNRLTVAQLLKDAGYHTACIGKWHLGWDWPFQDGKPLKKSDTGKTIDFHKAIKGGPTAVGFDYYFGDDVPNFPPYCFIENDHTIGIPTELKPKSMFGHRGMMLKGWRLDAVMPTITDKAVNYIKNNAKSKKPFFLYFALTAPHTPIAPAPQFRHKSKAGPYGDYVYEVDYCVGRVIDTLNQLGIIGDTLIIFTSDNGSPGRDGTNMGGPINSIRRKYHHNPSRPWRGIKADAWDGGHHVPFIACWKGHIPAHRVCAEPICHVDFMATAAALVGKKLPKNAAEDSYNMLNVLLGKPYHHPVRPAIISHSGAGLFCVRQGKWKLILGLGAGGFSGPILRPKPGQPHGQLYDMKNDPKEQKNVYLEHPDIVKKLTKLLDKYKKLGRSRDVN